VLQKYKNTVINAALLNNNFFTLWNENSFKSIASQMLRICEKVIKISQNIFELNNKKNFSHVKDKFIGLNSS
jgi:hypothetical protein